MDMDKAIGILGINRTRGGDVAPMAKALSLMPWLNTPEEEERLAAARFVLAHWSAYQAECNRRRDYRAWVRLHSTPPA